MVKFSWDPWTHTVPRPTGVHKRCVNCVQCECSVPWMCFLIHNTEWFLPLVQDFPLNVDRPTYHNWNCQPMKAFMGHLFKKQDFYEFYFWFKCQCVRLFSSLRTQLTWVLVIFSFHVENPQLQTCLRQEGVCKSMLSQATACHCHVNFTTYPCAIIFNSVPEKTVNIRSTHVLVKHVEFLKRLGWCLKGSVCMAIFKKITIYCFVVLRLSKRRSRIKLKGDSLLKQPDHWSQTLLVFGDFVVGVGSW